MSEGTEGRSRGTAGGGKRSLRSRLTPGERAQAVIGVVLSLGLLAFAVLWARCGIRGCPDVAQLRGYIPEEASVVLDRDGEEIGKLFQVNRVVVPIDSLPEHVPAAFVAAEDRRFWEHGGVDWQRVPGAALANVTAGGIEEGFSTITMQLARNLFPEKLPAEQQTVWRKLGEMRVANAIEDAYSKSQILQMYLNQVYFGNGAWGIEAAAQEYFGVPASELSVAQAALLASILPAPSRLNPRADPDAAIERRNRVIELMLEQERISAEEAESAREEELELAQGRAQSDVMAPYFLEAVRQELEDVFGNQLYTGGFRIHTTLDLDVQQSAKTELNQQLEAIESGRYGAYRHARYDPDAGPAGGETDYLQGAVVVMEAQTGAILALVGGRDFDQSKFNRALQARRQPGSAFKPFVYATALARGHPPSMILEDTPLRRVLSDGRVWSPGNYGGSYSGRITMREALVNSKNVATVRLSDQVGLDAILRTARIMGLEGDLPAYPSVVLGAGEVTLMDMVQAYSGFANLGERVEPYSVSRIEGRNGQTVWTRQPRARRVIDPAVAFLVTDMLQDVIDRGTGTAVRAAGFRGSAAGKTGTTNEATDVWFMGYTPSIVAGVWIGFDEPQTIVSGATGGSLAAPVWGRIMRDVPTRGGDWAPPPGVERRTVDEYGNVLAANCPTFGDTREEWFLTGTAPMSDCRMPRGMAWDTLGGWDSIYGWDSIPEDARDEEGWLDRLRGRIFGDDEDEVREREDGEIRPGRPEDTIPLYERPPRGRQQAERDTPEVLPTPDARPAGEPPEPDIPAPEPRDEPEAETDAGRGEPGADPDDGDEEEPEGEPIGRRPGSAD